MDNKTRFVGRWLVSVMLLLLRSLLGRVNRQSLKESESNLEVVLEWLLGLVKVKVSVVACPKRLHSGWE